MQRIRPTHLLILSLVCFATGCQNRCYQPCNNWLVGNPRIAPPPTYSLNIPNGANPYYNRSAANPNPTAAPANSSGAQFRPSNAVGAAPNANSGTQLVENTGAPQSVLVPNGQVNNTQLPATGQSFTDQRNFASTSSDERLDNTRIPVTDATAVRAPSQNFIAMNPSQTYANNNGYVAGSPYYSSAAVSVANPYVPTATPYYSAAPVMVANNPFQPALIQQPVVTQPAAADVNPGWRSREGTAIRRR